MCGVGVRREGGDGGAGGGAVDGTQGAGVAWHREEQSRVSWSREGCIPGPAPAMGPELSLLPLHFPPRVFSWGRLRSQADEFRPREARGPHTTEAL